MLQVIALKIECREEKRLEPGFSAAELAWLQRKHAGKDLLLVGHEDDFSLTIGRLTGGRVKLAKTGVALVELVAPNRGRLRWLVPPNVARA